MTDNFIHHKNKGNDFYKSNQYYQAIEEYSTCIKIDGSNHIPWANRAMCYIKIEKYNEAIKDCNKCLQISPKYIKAILRRGTARKALSKFILALKDYQKVLKYQPKNKQAKQEIINLKHIIQTKQSSKVSKQRNKIKNKNKKKRQTIIRKIKTNKQQTTNTNEFELKQLKKSISLNKKNKIFYGQLVVGPPGSGKTTYCNVISHYMTDVLHRNVAVINLDPNNTNMEYHPFIDICSLITTTDVAKYHHLGPNGSLIYCLEYLSSNMNWLRNQLDQLNDNTYLIFDCPGQIELYILNRFMKKITNIIVIKWNYNISCINLVDCHHICSNNNDDSSNFISLSLMTLSMMLHLELPHINILSKCDLLKYYNRNISMPIEFYTDGYDLHRLTQSMYNNVNDNQLLEIEKKFKNLTNSLAELVDDYGLVSWLKFSINDINSMKDVCKVIDKSNGYDLIGEYYNQIEMEQKILSARMQNMNNNTQEEKKNDDKKQQMHDVYTVKNPLLQNTPFHKTKLTSINEQIDEESDPDILPID